MRSRARSEAWLARIAALSLALALAAAYAVLASSEPRRALAAFFIGPFSSPYTFFALLENAGPLLVCALGAAIAFRSGAFNLGGEGQAAVGCLASALVLRALGPSPSLEPGLALPLALLGAAAAGAALASLSAFAESWSGAEILLTTFLLSQAALITVDWAIGGPFRDLGSNLLAMAPLPGQYRLPRLAPPSPLSLGAALALGLALAASLFVGRTRLGYELSLYGRGPGFARASGLGKALGSGALILSGALSGLAGGLLVLGQAGRAVEGMTGGVGWNGLAAALIANNAPLAAIPSALFLSWLDAGARQASIVSDLSPDASTVMKAVALLLITARYLPGIGTWRKRRLARGRTGQGAGQ